MRPVVLLALALALSGCGAPTNAASPAPAAASPTQRALAGTSGDYPPLSVARGDAFDGFAPALVTSFAASHRIEISWLRFRWPDLSSDLRGGRFEIVADGITVRPERSIAGRFTVPIARGGAVLLLRRPPWAARATGPADLDRAELRIAVNRGGHLERVAHQLFHSADVRAIPNNAAVRDALAHGEVDAAMTNTFEAPQWAEGLSGIERIGPLTNDVTAIWVRADREALADELDAWLLDEEESGRLGALRAKWLGEAPKTAGVVAALSAAIAERLSLMPFVAAAKKRAGRAIEDPAQEGRVLGSARTEVKRAAGAGAVPPTDAIDAFFRLQIEAAKAVQTQTAVNEDYDLDRDLRPAIARITGREARLIVRLPRGLAAADVETELHRDLDTLGGTSGLAGRFAQAIVSLGVK